ncbi:FMN-binding negative transcriptional regulator [Pedobacter sp. MW01-1-1]|uniref:FMN-binding negative transcriptional regulator n=1 Tax=Pedobacter sp. MW01-1-1 TaxID=3383027 RepID=UPI003FEF463F
MYKISPFTVTNQEEIHAFMQAHPFATVISYDGIYPVATQVPLLIKQEDGILKLYGHVMRKSDHCEAFAQHEAVLVLFNGPHAYVSASVYQEPAQASTWNYKSVQVKGKLNLVTPEETYHLIQALTEQYENSTSPSAFSKIDPAYIQKHLKAIIGFEITVTEINATFKLSQNHPSFNQEKIIENLQQSDDPLANQIAQEMAKTKKD